MEINTHILSTFNKDLATLKEHLAQLVETVDKSLENALVALKTGDTNLCKQIIAEDDLIDTQHRLIDALAMVTVRPANLAAIGSAQMASKGRLQIGADADITVFDATTIIDRSTIENPAQESLGVEYVFVNGTEVRNPDGNVSGARPGVAITSNFA